MGSKTGLYIVSMVAIVGFVGIVVMLIGSSGNNAADAAATDSFGNVVSVATATTSDLADSTDIVSTNSATASVLYTGDYTPRIAYWYGKVNQHINTATGVWETDPDGTSGANIDMLTYCKKWYGNSITNFTAYKTENISGWRDAGNANYYIWSKTSYKCVQESKSSVDVKVNGANSPNPVAYNSKITVSWTTTGNIQYCIGNGHYVPTYSTPYRIWFSDASNDNYKYGSFGSVDLLSAFAYNGDVNSLSYMSLLTIGMTCVDSNGNAISDSVSVPVNAPTVTCTDSDGLNFNNKGYVLYQSVRYDDYCISEYGVAEEYCNGTQKQVMFRTCGTNEYCSDGACVMNTTPASWSCKALGNTLVIAQDPFPVFQKLMTSKGPGLDYGNGVGGRWIITILGGNADDSSTIIQVNNTMTGLSTIQTVRVGDVKSMVGLKVILDAVSVTSTTVVDTMYVYPILLLDPEYYMDATTAKPYCYNNNLYKDTCPSTVVDEDSEFVKTLVETCPNGCSDGACVMNTTPVSWSCKALGSNLVMTSNPFPAFTKLTLVKGQSATNYVLNGTWKIEVLGGNDDDSSAIIRVTNTLTSISDTRTVRAGDSKTMVGLIVIIDNVNATSTSAVVNVYAYPSGLISAGYVRVESTNNYCYFNNVYKYACPSVVNEDADFTETLVQTCSNGCSNGACIVADINTTVPSYCADHHLYLEEDNSYLLTSAGVDYVVKAMQVNYDENGDDTGAVITVVSDGSEYTYSLERGDLKTSNGLTFYLKDIFVNNVGTQTYTLDMCFDLQEPLISTEPSYCDTHSAYLVEGDEYELTSAGVDYTIGVDTIDYDASDYYETAVDISVRTDDNSSESYKINEHSEKTLNGLTLYVKEIFVDNVASTPSTTVNVCFDIQDEPLDELTFADYPQPFITEDGIVNTLFVVGRKAAIDDVIGISDIVASLQRYAGDNPFPVGVVKFDDEVTDDMLYNRNLILVGGMCANTAADRIYGHSSDCNSQDSPGVGHVKIIRNRNTDKLVILVHGYSAADTTLATRVLAQWEDYGDEFTSTDSLCVSGTVNSMTVTKC